MEYKKIKLSTYIASLQSRGKYTFTREEAMANLHTSPEAFKLAALRLIKKRRLYRIKEGFYVIVPLEYREKAIVPPAWYIDSLMNHYKQPYYVGLLSAAALYGAAHQQPQVFQVITSSPIRPCTAENLSIQFFTKKAILPSSYRPMKTPTGYMNVSLPEITALDMIQYAKSLGSLSHVSTVLSELQESFDIQRLKDYIENGAALPNIQRLGYLLELIEASPEIISLFRNVIEEKKPRIIPLRRDKLFEKNQKNLNWRLYINEKIEIDT